MLEYVLVYPYLNFSKSFRFFIIHIPSVSSFLVPYPATLTSPLSFISSHPFHSHLCTLSSLSQLIFTFPLLSLATERSILHLSFIPTKSLFSAYHFLWYPIISPSRKSIRHIFSSLSVTQQQTLCTPLVSSCLPSPVFRHPQFSLCLTTYSVFFPSLLPAICQSHAPPLYQQTPLPLVFAR